MGTALAYLGKGKLMFYERVAWQSGTLAMVQFRLRKDLGKSSAHRGFVGQDGLAHLGSAAG
ncbi:MAG: hypothetical protein CM1200mP2_15680 [Planctomycetaceae bacterium]|nr:MAG: hypothetical protein CM1200mP2_15680 [Planctomycetaceae bacterium]